VGTSRLPHRGILLVGAVTCLVLGNASLALAVTQSSAAAAAHDTVTICHATDSDQHPYVVEHPAKDGDVGGHADHTGPLWDATLKDQHIAWGDIIPAFDYTDQGVVAHFPGLNATADGQAILANDCKVPGEAPTLSLSVAKSNDADANGTFSDSETATTAGASVAFQVTVTNTSSVPVVIDGVVDAIGQTTIPFDCAPSPVGTTLPVGGTATCTVTLAGYAPAAGTSVVNDVTVSGHQADNPANTTSGQDTSTVATASDGGTTGDVTTGTTGDTTTGTTGDTTGTTGDTTGTTGGATTGTSTGGGGGTITTPTTSGGTPFTGGGGTIVSLPFTGVPTGLLAGAAAALLTVGSFLTFAGRRRNA
jgi:hypothetical protein